jgi:hypothetical protein
MPTLNRSREKPPEAVSARTLRMLDAAAANLKAGRASPPVDLTAFSKD